VEQGNALTEAPRASDTVTLVNLAKCYGATRALDGVSLSVAPGEFFTLLGPSGCGKTTTLRSVAGFVTPDTGEVAINGRTVPRVPPHLRRVGMVFQHYALFPHRTVAQNVGFGLRMQRMERAEIARLVAEALALVQLPGHGDRYPGQLSGGEQQRVALARAMIKKPFLLLADEPTAQLDSETGKSVLDLMRDATRSGTAILLATHDQAVVEVADRVLSMEDGQLAELATAPADP
jgi:ABC-type Fe3+/spermidine/putrescine transport system ATPase subunit